MRKKVWDKIIKKEKVIIFREREREFESMEGGFGKQGRTKFIYFLGKSRFRKS